MSGAGGVVSLSRRSILNTLRQPQMWVPSMVFPLVFTALTTGAMGRATRLPGFPADSFLDFAVASAVVQGVLFGATAGGSDMAVDIQDGFFDRLISSPVSRPGIVVARLAGAAVLGALQALVFMAVLTAFGAHIRGGPGAVLTIVAVAMLLAMAIGGLSVAIALKTGSSEVVQAAFPVFFISLFTSSAFFPRELMSGWFKTVASLNPLSFMIESVRALILGGFHVGDAIRALTIVAALAGVSLVLCLAALRSRLAAR
ncbi:MAG: ABC transporter permease [Actinobacteria bacterium]|nr:ABC transporter permease [Actinomycetota bacterium]